MKLISTQSKFVNIFTMMNMGGLFNPIVMDVKKTMITMVGRDASDIALTSQKFRDIEIEGEDVGKIVFDPEEMLNAFKLFKPDDEMSINILDNTIIVSNADDAEINDVISIPQIDIDTIDDPEFPFKIVKGLPIITNKNTGEQIEFSINATIPVRYLTEVIKRANYADINPRLYKLVFTDGTLKGIIGSSSDFQRSVTTTVNIEGEGSGSLLLGSGLEEMVKTLSGDITINASSNAPSWFTMKSDNNIVHVLIAPASIE